MNPRELRQRLIELVDELRDRFDELPEDRQRQVRLGGVALAVLLPLLLIVLPLASARMAANQELAAAAEQVEEMRRLEELVLRKGLNQEAQRDDRARRTPRRSLLSTVDQTANKLQIANKVKSVRPLDRGRDDNGGEAVEIQLQGLVLEEIARLLYELEIDSEGIQIRKLEVQKDLGRPNVLRANLEVAQ